MKYWIAHEHDAFGMRTDAFLVVVADTQDDARRVMAEAITRRREAEQARELRARISEIFIEAPDELAGDDPRAAGVRAEVPSFEGFDRPGP